LGETPPGLKYYMPKGGRRIRGEIMKDTKEMLRIVGIILLGLFVLVVAVPLVFAAAGLVVVTTVGIVAALVKLAVLLIKVAVTLAIIYLILAGVRAALK
jgi:hypothetical protein